MKVLSFPAMITTRPRSGLLPRRLLSAALVACVAGLSSTESLAETAPPPATSASMLESVLQDLNANDVMARENAGRRLAIDESFSLNQIGAMMARPGLTPEQGTRLARAFRERFSISPRPAIGIGFELSPSDPRGILVNSAHPGCPAIDQGILKVGDIIVSLAGRRLIEPADLAPVPARFPNNGADSRMRIRTISLIQSFDPGDTIKAVVLRLVEPRPELKLGADQFGQTRLTPDPKWPREEVQLDIPLGLYSALPNERAVSSGILMRLYGETAMDERLRRLGVTWPVGAPIRAAASIPETDHAPPMAASAWQFVRLAGSGRDLQWATALAGFDRGAMDIREALAQAENQIRLNAQIPRNDRRMMANNQIREFLRAGIQGGGVPVAVVNRRQAAADMFSNTAADPAGVQAADTPEPDSTARALSRLAEIKSALEEQERVLATGALSQPSQRAGEELATRLRTEMEQIARRLTEPSTGRTPTVTSEDRAAGFQAVDR